MTRILLSAFLLACAGHVIQGEISIDKFCHWNYTKQNKKGADLYKVTSTMDTDTKNCPHQTSAPKGNFNITVLGDESDLKMRLNIEWKTSQTSVRLWVSFVDVTDPKIAVPKTGCFVFRIKQVSRKRLPWKHLQFDCLEIKRGVVGSFDICELGTRTVCGALNIDTRKCSCDRTYLNASLVQYTENDMTKHLIRIHNREASENMSVQFTVRRNGELFYDAKKNYYYTSSHVFYPYKYKIHHLSHYLTLDVMVSIPPYLVWECWEPITIPKPLEEDGNYTVQVSLFCLDFSKQRQNQECQYRVFDFVVSSTKPRTSEPPDLPDKVLYAVVGGVSTVTVCLLVGLIYKLGKKPREAENSPVNNNDVSSALLSSCHNWDVKAERRNDNAVKSERQMQN